MLCRHNDVRLLWRFWRKHIEHILTFQIRLIITKVELRLASCARVKGNFFCFDRQELKFYQTKWLYLMRKKKMPYGVHPNQISVQGYDEHAVVLIKDTWYQIKPTLICYINTKPRPTVYVSTHLNICLHVRSVDLTFLLSQYVLANCCCFFQDTLSHI